MPKAANYSTYRYEPMVTSAVNNAGTIYVSAVAAKSLPTSGMTTPDAEKVFVMTGEL